MAVLRDNPVSIEAIGDVQANVRPQIEALVKQIAYSHGFSHLGHFSSDYRQLFGEAPSETLRRR